MSFIEATSWQEESFFREHEDDRLLPTELEVGMICTAAALLDEQNRPPKPAASCPVQISNIEKLATMTEVVLVCLDESGKPGPLVGWTFLTSGYVDLEPKNRLTIGKHPINCGYLFGIQLDLDAELLKLSNSLTDIRSLASY